MVVQFWSTTIDVFVVNCHSVVNIPFYQKLFAKFNITYSVICDTDHTSNSTGWNNIDENPSFSAGAQKTIAELYAEHTTAGLTNKFFVFSDNFEVCHKALTGNFKFDDSKKAEGKPFMANQYWQQLQTHATESGYDSVPVIRFFDVILKGSTAPAVDSSQANAI